MLTLLLNNEIETEHFGQKASQLFLLGGTVYLKGNLGAGKTTFVRGLLRGKNYFDKVKSPTFSLVEEYNTAFGQVVHCDLYRLEHAEELENIGFRDYLNARTLLLIEWPEKGDGFLPLPDLVLSFKILSVGRELSIQAFSEKGNDELEQLKKLA